MPQGTLVDMDIVLNAQSFIDVSRKRLCGMASYETREAWKKVIEALRKVDPNLADCCVPNCVYRGVFVQNFVTAVGITGQRRLKRNF